MGDAMESMAAAWAISAPLRTAGKDLITDNEGVAALMAVLGSLTPPEGENHHRPWEVFEPCDSHTVWYANNSSSGLGRAAVINGYCKLFRVEGGWLHGETGKVIDLEEAKALLTPTGREASKAAWKAQEDSKSWLRHVQRLANRRKAEYDALTTLISTAGALGLPFKIIEHGDWGGVKLSVDGVEMTLKAEERSGSTWVTGTRLMRGEYPMGYTQHDSKVIDPVYVKDADKNRLLFAMGRIDK